ncbi:MAG: TonB-dependent receptor plug domain-containing protein, partial [Chitinophagaceae bacterium]|nr:TonB-dependent receptor plug domain-containing protein [Chitinophagaceae bacterium]
MRTLTTKRLISTLTFLLLLSVSLFAQDRVITGKITNTADGTPVAGASVSVKGTDRAVSADNNGNFSISVPSNATTLTISSVGFLQQDVSIINSAGAVYTLSPQANSEADVIVVGYGTKSKKNITGAVVKVDEAQIRDMPFASPDQLIQGKASGVQVGSMSGTPGGGVTVRVRGTTSFSPNSPASQPLYIIDGVFMNTTPLGPAGYGVEQQVSNPLADINPSDIQSMEILKDANSTAIFGSRGANGVIIITTKRGAKGNAKVSLNTYYAAAKA